MTMALYDRDYYRDDDFGRRATHSGRVTIGFVALLSSLFAFQLLGRHPHGPDDFFVEGALNSSKIVEGEVWRVFTGAFLQEPKSESVLTFALSMLVLFIFGRALEEELGHAEYVGYLTIVIIVNQLSEFISQASGLQEPHDMAGSLAAVTAVVVLYAFRHPHEIWRLFLIVPVPMWSIATAYVIINVFRSGSVSLATLTLGGASMALAYHLFHRPIPLRKPQPRQRKVPPKANESYESEEQEELMALVPRQPREVVDEQLEAKVDQVLEKVARTGRQSLSREENDVLMRASAVYRRRRSH